MSLGGGKSESESESIQQSSGMSEAMSSYSGADESSTGATYGQDVWGGQSPYLQDLYGQAGNVFGTSQPGLADQTGAATNYMNQVTGQVNPAWAGQLEGGAYAGMDLSGQLNQLMAGGADTGSTGQIYAQMMGGEGNTYADAMKNQYMQDATRAQENMMSNLDARAAASGMSGGSRHGTATAKGMEDINRNLQGEMAKVGYETFDKDLQQKLNIAQMADANQLARYQGDQAALQSMLGQQQAGMQGAIGSAQGMQDIGMSQFAPGMIPYEQLGQYANVLGAPTLLDSGTQFGLSSGSQEGLSEAYSDWQSFGSMSDDSKSSHGGIGH